MLVSQICVTLNFSTWLPRLRVRHLGFYFSPCIAASTSPLRLTCLVSRFWVLRFLRFEFFADCFSVHRSFFPEPLYLFRFLFSVLVHAVLLFIMFSLFLTVLVSLFSVSASGEGGSVVNTADVCLTSIVEGSSVAHFPFMSPEVIADMQRRIKENIVLVNSLH